MDVRLRTKALFWVLLGVWSTVLAEVWSGSFPLPFATVEGPLMVVPVYLVHAVAGLWLLSKGPITFTRLWLIGVLFGFYEFYLTRVLFDPPWGALVHVGGIDWIAVAVLAGFWHPLLAWMLPLGIVERTGLATRGVWDQLPVSIRRGGASALGLLVLAAIFHGSLAGPTETAVLSLVTTGVGLGLCTWWWRRDPARRALTLTGLAPTNRQVVPFLIAIVAMYAFLGELFRPDAAPEGVTNIIVFVLYGIVGATLLGAGSGTVVERVVEVRRLSPWLAGGVYVAITLAASVMVPADWAVAVLWVIAFLGRLAFAWRAGKETSTSRRSGRRTGDPLPVRT